MVDNPEVVSMDQRLIAWARAVKRRNRLPHPVLWLFTDARGPDPLAFARHAPRGLSRGLSGGLSGGLCGIVLRSPLDAAAAAKLARACRERRLALTVAGDWRLARALGAGLHLRDGRKPPNAPRAWPFFTSSAHGAASLRRARAAGALAFLSPAFPTASHPGAPALGPARWSRLAGAGPDATAPYGVAALGGITGRTIRRLPRAIAAGAIGALLHKEPAIGALLQKEPAIGALGPKDRFHQ
jgi:thiamine-phosphate pyrophosphorylase